MHTRSRSWYLLSHDGIELARSNDGWVRLRIALHASPRDRRSWALDPVAAHDRTWSEVSLGELRDLEPRPETRALLRQGEDVEGESNPHEDSRGLVAGNVQATRIDPPSAALVSGVQVSRTRDGIRVDLPLADEARVYGLGEKTGGLDKRGRTWTFWNSDEPTHTADRDPLYESIPVGYLFTPNGTTTVFSDSPATQYFDVCDSQSGVLSIEAYDHQLDLYLRHDSSLPDAVAAYAGLTGTMPLPPEWALGFQQCRYSYMPESRVMEVARRMREEQIPCDVIYLDIHYMDGYRVFTWDPARFPDPERMIRELRELGFRVVTIIDPGVKVDPEYGVYADGYSKGLFLTKPDGTPYVGKVWPGDAVFPDFTREEVRNWWADHHRAVLGAGVAGIWNDMNEPADFTGNAEFRPDWTVPDDLVAGNDGEPVAFGRVHNAYAAGMNEGTRRAIETLLPDERGFVLTRAGYAGIQRRAAVWTGDNHSWWEHVSLMIPMQLNLSMSGVAFCGADTGGFQGNASGELFARWIAASCLMPFLRTHTALDTRDHEAWVFGEEALNAVKAHVSLRYQLLPYLYTLMEESSRTGAPAMRPLVWEFPDDPRVADRADSFLLGRSLLVAPVRERGVQERSVYLPAGTWFNAWTGSRHVGPATIVAEAALDRLPLFIRGGSIVPYEAMRRHTGEKGDGVLRLLVAPDDDSTAAGELYADAGEGYEYRDGRFWRARFESKGEQVAVTTTAGEGSTASRFGRVCAVPVGAGFPTEGGTIVDLGPGNARVRIEA
ncbi:MAG: TIM-barrel domain-containing protein [bacterium]